MNATARGRQPAPFAAIDLRALAALRVALALIVLFDVGMRTSMAAVLQSGDGVYPLEIPRGTSLRYVVPHLISGSLAFQLGLNALAAIGAIAMLVGYRTRASTVLTFVLVVSLNHRNPNVGDVGDASLSCILFWCLFLPLGARWSFDAARAEAPRVAHGTATLALMGQVGAILLMAGLTKLRSDAWLEGRALAENLTDDLWTRPLGWWVRGQDELAHFLTHATLAIEIGAPLLLLSPVARRVTRPLGLLLAGGLVLGLGLTLSLGITCLVLASGLLVFVPSAVWDRLDPTASKQRAATPDAPEPWHLDAARPRWATAALATLAVVVLLANVSSATRWFRIPSKVERGLEVIGMGHSWPMYLHPEVGSRRYVLRLETEVGPQTITVGTPRRGWPTATSWAPLDAIFWHTYRGRAFLHDNVGWEGMAPEQDALLGWIADRWNEVHPEARVHAIELHREKRTPPAEHRAAWTLASQTLLRRLELARP